MNFYHHHIGDYASATRHLSWDEDLAYRRLIEAYYANEQPLPLDRARVHRLAMAQTPKHRAAVDQVLVEYFYETPDGWRHKHCDEELAAVALKKEKASQSARKRWGEQDAMPSTSEGNADAMRPHSDGNAPTPTPTPTPSKERDGPYGPLSSPDVKTAFDAYNETAKRLGLPQAAVLTDRRRTALSARLSECGGLAGWNAAMGRLEQSPHCRGENDRGWKADFDFVTQQKSFTRLMEGSYGGRSKTGGSPRKSHLESIIENLTGGPAEGGIDPWPS